MWRDVLQHNMQSKCQHRADCCQQRLGPGEERMFHKGGRRWQWNTGLKDCRNSRCRQSREGENVKIPEDCSESHKPSGTWSTGCADE